MTIYPLNGQKVLLHEGKLYALTLLEPEGAPQEAPSETSADELAPRRKYTRKTKPAPKKEKKGKRGGARACKNCGTLGHLAKTCPEKRSDTEVDIGDRVREMQEEGRSALTICRELKIPMKTIKKYWNFELSNLPEASLGAPEGEDLGIETP